MIKWLELKIPPAALFLIFTGLMWGVSKIAPLLFASINLNYEWGLIQFVRNDDLWNKWIGMTLLMIGIIIGLLALASFWRAKTTVDPHRPESVSKFVDSGVYKLSRNPMYLGLLLGLMGWTIYLANVFNILLVIAFVLYMNRFQIIPEEKVMDNKFRGDFKRYKKNVRRWI